MSEDRHEPQLVKKGFDKLVDVEASSPAKPENPKGFQPSCHPLQSPLKIKDFSGAEPAGKRFFSGKWDFFGAKIALCPPYTPLGAIESSRGLRPSRALWGFLTVWAGENPLRLLSCSFLGRLISSPEPAAAVSPVGHRPELLENEESGGSNLWPTDS